MQNPYARYKEQSVMTMTQGDMINLLFDEVIDQIPVNGSIPTGNCI